MDPKSYDYYLPPEQIANAPASPRDSSRLLVLDKRTGNIDHHIFRELPDLLKPTDVLVFNQTKVFPARLFGTKTTGGKVEVLLIKKISPNTWQALSKPGLKNGQIANFSPEVSCEVITQNSDATVVLRFNNLTDEQLNALGHMPLPPYIHSNQSESKLKEEYQTVYAKAVGSAAAPTAGLHFTQKLLSDLHKKGIQTEFVTLHVGLGTFKPLTEENLRSGKLHSETFELDTPTAVKLNHAKAEGRRIIAVGTTTTRVLETCSSLNGVLIPQKGDTDIFIHPPYHFKFIDGIVTNFHLPQTSLMMLVSSLVADPKFILNAYQTAIKEKYRFYSFGDAMLIL